MCPSRETYRLTPIQSSVISIQIEEQNHICHANSVDVCPCASTYEWQVQCVVLYSAHTLNQMEGFVDSNLTLCDLQICSRRGLCTGM